jgi:hypothetical protein
LTDSHGAKQAESGAPGRPRAWAAWIALAAVLALTAVVRIRLLDIPLERDEGEYAYAGQLLLDGIPPYQFAYNMKLPGAYIAYAAAMAVFGQSAAGIHMGLLVVSLISTIMLFLIARESFGSGPAAFASANFALAGMSFPVLGLHAHATHFVVCPALCGLWLLTRSLRLNHRHGLAAAGFLMGCAFLAKQQGVFFPLFAIVYAAVWSRRFGGASPQIAFERSKLVAAGAAAPYLLTFAWLWLAGVVPRFWFWTVTYARLYTAEVPVAEAPGRLFNALQAQWDVNGTLWLAALAGAAILWIHRRATPEAMLVGMMLAAGFLAVCPGFYFRGHYWVVLLPGLALASAAALEAVHTHGGDRAAVALAALCVGLPLVKQAPYLFEASPLFISRAEYGNQPFHEAKKVAEYLRGQASPRSTVAVLGSEPQIYFHSGLRSATGYIYVYGLMEEQPLAEQMQREMISEIERARPEFMVGVSHPGSWLIRPGSKMLIQDWMASYAKENYDVVKLVPVPSQSELDRGLLENSDPKLSSEGIVVWKRKS